MDVTFFADDPKRKARAVLDDVLSKGTDELAIACAFCTGAGVEVLMKHVARLKNAGSFVVVAAQMPTDYTGLERLHHEIPQNLFVHWGAQSPVEKKAGAALMHSKVFYARSGRECWLWTGSHNLTGNATQGGNCEAAVLLHGDATEKPFVDALKHLHTCRNESTLYDPNTPPPVGPIRADMIAIHAEVESIPRKPLPWHIQLSLNSADFDKLLGPPANVRLLLYPTGALENGWQAADPIASYSGSVTGQNLTERNPRTLRAGINAEWRAADFGIVDRSGVLHMGVDTRPATDVTTQVMFFINTESDATEALFTEAPKLESRPIPGQSFLTELDKDMLPYFTNFSVKNSRLVNTPYVGRRDVISMAEIDRRSRDVERVRKSFQADEYVLIDYAPRQSSREKRHPFIFRVRYRLGDE